MNKNLYRIIFNKKRGCMMAVAENTTREGKSAQDSTCVATSILSAVETGLPGLTAFLVLMSGIGFAHAQIISDRGAPANQQAVILKTSAGAPLINIQTPNAKGLSHNRYTQFDVDAKGAVLNNSRTGNPHLAKGAAQIILNEIRSNNPSKLGGMVSVEGAKADVIIANPSGIQVNGGGFKNAGRAVLTTGTPVLKDGTLGGFDVRKGTVTVGSSGLDSRQTDFTEILARAAAIQGKTQSSHLAVSTGPQKTDYQSGEITAGIAEGTKPATGIDTAALGGMYANSITLIANEKGVGVKNAGTLEAQRQLVVTSAGRIENSGNIRTVAASAKDAPTYLGLEATESGTSGAVISNGGTIESKGLLVVESGEDIGLRNGAVIQNSGETETGLVLNAGRNLIIEQSAAVNNRKGSIYMDSGAKTVVNNASISASSSSIRSHSKADTVLQTGSRLNAKGDVAVLSNSNIGVDGGSITAQTGNIHIEAAKPVSLKDDVRSSNVTLNNGNISAAKNAVILADNDINTDTTAFKSADNIYLHANQNLNLTVGTELTSKVKDLDLKAGGKATIKTTATKTLAATGKLSIEAGNLNIDKVNLKTTTGDLSITAATGDIIFGKDSRLDSGKNTEVSALLGNIRSDGLNVNAGGYASVLANADVEIKNSVAQTTPSLINGKAGINLGSVGKGRLKADNTDIRAIAGEVNLVSGSDMQLGNGVQRNTIAGNGIHAKSGGSITADNQSFNAGSGALTATAHNNLTLKNVQTASTHNTVIVAENGNTVLNDVTVASKRHIAVSSQKGAVLQNHNQNSRNSLTAQGVLSVQSDKENIVRYSTIKSGAVNLKSNKSHVDVSGNSSIQAVSSPLLKTDAALRAADGSINIESGGNFTLHAGNNLTADGDITVKADGRLKAEGLGGTAGNPSAVTSNMTAKGNIKLVGADANINGAKITAGKDLTVAGTKGQLDVSAVMNTFGSYISNERIAQLRTEINNMAQELSSLKAKQSAIENSAEYRNLQGMLWDILESAKLDPGYMHPIDMVAAIEKNGLRPADWENIKAKMQPHKARIDNLSIQKANLEKILATIQSPGRGHEHKPAELSGKNVTLLSTQGINVSGSKITATQGQAVLQAAGLLPAPSAEAKSEGRLRSAISINGVFDTFEYGQNGSDHYAYALFNRPSEISGKTGVTVAAPSPSGDSRIILSASDLSSDAGKISLKSYSDQLYTAGQGELYTFDKHSYKTGKWYKRRHITEIREHKNAKADPTNLTAAKGIEIKTGGSLHAYATVFDAPKGTVDIQAGRELKLFAVDEINYDKLDSRKKRRFLGITYDKVHDTSTGYMQTALPSRVVAESANLKSGWDTLLQGTEFQTGLGGAKIQAGVGEQARADAKIILQGIKTNIVSDTESTAKSALWQKQAARGSVIETLKLPSFEGPTAPILTAPGGFIADIPKGRLKDEIDKLAKQPEYAYLKQIQTTRNVDWKQVNLAYDKWNYKQEGMTPAAAAVVVIVVTVLTYGGGTAAAGGAAGGAAAGGGTATAGASATAGSAAAAGSSAAIGAAAAKAALASIASQAAVSLINNKGNLDQTLKELGKSSTLKQAATAAVTAGVLQGLSGITAEAANAATQEIGKSWAGKFTANLINTSASAGVSTAINGGSLKDNLGNAALGALVNTVHGEIASKIKVGLSEDYITHKITHAVAGCGAEAANKGKCLDGAIGAAVGEIVAEAYGKPDINLPDAEYQRQTDKLLAVTKIISGSVSSLLGGNFEKTADVAENTVMNNFLYPEQDADIKKQLANCAGQHAGSSLSLLACQGRVIKTAHMISEQNDRLLAAAYEAAKKGNSTELNRLNQSFTRATDAKGIAQLKSVLKAQYPKASEARITELAGQSITRFQQDWHLAKSRVAAVAPTEFVNKATGLTAEIAGAALAIREAYTLGKGIVASRTPLSSLNLSKSEQDIVSRLVGSDGVIVVNGQQTPIARLPNDIKVGKTPPPAKNLNGRIIGRSEAQNKIVQTDAAYLKSLGAGDIRINQQQVNRHECRVGLCRPDLQATLPSGKRIYIEYDRASSKRGPGHASRILSNDPDSIVILRTVD